VCIYFDETKPIVSSENDVHVFTNPQIVLQMEYMAGWCVVLMVMAIKWRGNFVDVSESLLCDSVCDL